VDSQTFSTKNANNKTSASLCFLRASHTLIYVSLPLHKKIKNQEQKMSLKKYTYIHLIYQCITIPETKTLKEIKLMFISYQSFVCDNIHDEIEQNLA